MSHQSVTSNFPTGEIVELLWPGTELWSAEDGRLFFDERAAIAVSHGGLSRLDAEVQAFTRCVVEWLNHNPVTSSPDAAPGGKKNFEINP